jgi:hypothetical protein
VITFLGDDADMRQLISKLDLPNGSTSVVIHGTPGAFEIERGGQLIKISQRELANYIKANGGVGDGPVVLFSCWSGEGTYQWPIAQDLANKLGREVWAPTKAIKIDSFRNPWMKYPVPGRTIFRVGPKEDPGAWRLFKPKLPRWRTPN